MKKLWGILAGLLRELSDEAPYQRYLLRQGRLHTPAEWRRFTDRRLTARFERPKCC